MSITRTMVLAAVAAMLAACSQQPGQPQPSASPSGTYTDPDFGYGIHYDPPFAPGNVAGINAAATGNNPAASTATFYDTEVKVSRVSPPTGIGKAQADAAAKNIDPGVTFYPVGLSVSVFPLTVPVTAENLAQAEAQLKVNVLPQLAQGAAPPKLTPTTVAGRPGFTATMTVPAQAGETGQPVRAQLYWVFAESNEYQVSMQAPVSEWSKVAPTFEKMLGTLTLPGTWASASPSGSPAATASPPATRTPTRQ